MSNKEIENRAIAFVLAHELAAGRDAHDSRNLQGSPVDVQSYDLATGRTLLIEVKAFGGAGRGEFLWLEENQVEALEGNSDGHIYILTNVRSENSSDIQLLDLTGEALHKRLLAKRPKAYFEGPLPKAEYDRLRAAAAPAPTESGPAFALKVLRAVTVLHDRGYHRIRFESVIAPTGMHVRLAVGREQEMTSGFPQHEDLERTAFISVGGEELAARKFADTMVPAWWTPEMVADQILTALPPVEPTTDDPEYVCRLAEFLKRASAAGETPVTDDGDRRP